MKKATFKLCLLYALSISFYGCENQTRNETDTSTEVVTSSQDVKTTEPEVVKNTCVICNREFEGLGYQEVSEGVWEPCEYPYQCFICGPSCGMSHTRKMNDLVEKAERIGNQSGDYIQGKDGSIYETNACSLCKGTGIEKNTAQDVFGGSAGRKCPMCDGRGVRSY